MTKRRPNPDNIDSCSPPTHHEPTLNHPGIERTITMEQFKWIALPVTALGLVFLFFGMIWQGAVQLAVAVALLAGAASIWRTTTGTWPLTQTEPP
jgi:hypothetical protein